MITTGATDFDIARLRARRTNKWHKFPPDVLPAWVADMDFGVASSITAALARLREGHRQRLRLRRRSSTPTPNAHAERPRRTPTPNAHAERPRHRQHRSRSPHSAAMNLTEKPRPADLQKNFWKIFQNFSMASATATQ
jgi:hypothetical protein